MTSETIDGRTPEEMIATPENFNLTKEEVKRVLDGADGEVYGLVFMAFTENGARRIVGHQGKDHSPKAPWVSFQVFGNAFKVLCEAVFDPLRAFLSGNPVAQMATTFGASAECSYDGCPGCENCDPDMAPEEDDDLDPEGTIADLFRNGMVF